MRAEPRVESREQRRGQREQGFVAEAGQRLDDLARQTMAKALAGAPTFRGLDDAKQLAAKLQ